MTKPHKPSTPQPGKHSSAGSAETSPTLRVVHVEDPMEQGASKDGPEESTSPASQSLPLPGSLRELRVQTLELLAKFASARLWDHATSLRRSALSPQCEPAATKHIALITTNIAAVKERVEGGKMLASASAAEYFQALKELEATSNCCNCLSLSTNSDEWSAGTKPPVKHFTPASILQALIPRAADLQDHAPEGGWEKIFPAILFHQAITYLAEENLPSTVPVAFTHDIARVPASIALNSLVAHAVYKIVLCSIQARALLVLELSRYSRLENIYGHDEPRLTPAKDLLIKALRHFNDREFEELLPALAQIKNVFPSVIEDEGVAER